MLLGKQTLYSESSAVPKNHYLRKCVEKNTKEWIQFLTANLHPVSFLSYALQHVETLNRISLQYVGPWPAWRFCHNQSSSSLLDVCLKKTAITRAVSTGNLNSTSRGNTSQGKGARDLISQYCWGESGKRRSLTNTLNSPLGIAGWLKTASRFWTYYFTLHLNLHHGLGT